MQLVSFAEVRYKGQFDGCGDEACQASIMMFKEITSRHRFRLSRVVLKGYDVYENRRKGKSGDYEVKCVGSVT
jgi:hypothetical protein